MELRRPSRRTPRSFAARILPLFTRGNLSSTRALHVADAENNVLFEPEIETKESVLGLRAQLIVRSMPSLRRRGLLGSGALTRTR